MDTYQALLLDVDGVLLNGAGEVTPRTRAALRGAVERGLVLTLATGRTRASLERVLDGAGLPPHDCITNGGALSWRRNDSADGAADGAAEPQLAQAMAASLWPPLVQALEGAGLNAIVYEAMGAALRVWVRSRRGHPHFEAYLQRNRNQICASPRLGEAPLGLVVQVAAIGGGAAFVRESAEVRARFAAQTRNHTMALYIQQAYGLITEFFPPGVSKWAAFARLHPQLARRPQGVIAVGDEANDREMLAAAGMGVAMGNAPAEIQRIARTTTASSDQDGLAQALERLLELPAPAAGPGGQAGL